MITDHLLAGRRSITPPPTDAFREAVVDYLRNEEGTSSYDQLRHTYLDTDRFERWVRVVEGHRPVEGADVLVSGCQSGGSLVAWWAGGARHVHGLDIDRALVDLATTRIAGLDACDAAIYDGRDIPLPAGSIDIVESLDVIEHVPWPQHYLAEIARVLRPGGVVVLSTPNRAWPVEQHIRVAGPPWLGIEPANRAATWAAERLPLLSEDLRRRLRLLPDIRAVNVSFARLRRWSIDAGLRLELPDPAARGADWPLPHDARPVERASRHRLGKFVAPTQHLVALLWKD